MKIKDIIKTSAVLLNKEKIIAYLQDSTNSTDTQTLSEINNLTVLSNSVISELACSYIPMVKEQSVSGLEVDYTSLTESPLKICAIYDKNGNKLNFIQKTTSVATDSEMSKIVYEYMPAMYNLTDEIGYKESDITSGILAFGLCAEYCLSQARFDEAVVFHERYIDGVNKCVKLKNKKVKTRKWV